MLEIKDISKTYDNGHKAIKNISFSIADGEFLSIIGPSGAGKSTVLRSINQLITDDSGQILFNDQDIRQANKQQLRKIRAQIGMVFQNYNLVGRLSAIENVLHGALGRKSTISGALGWYTLSEKQSAAALLDLVGLGDFIYTRANELSGGQMQRVGIARALMQEPKIILTDEPIASLDPQSTTVVMDYLKKIAVEMNITVIANLHQVEIAKKYSDHIVGINNGQVVFNGQPNELTPAQIVNVYGNDVGAIE
ncbi:phosphonate ABC transporter ATP-binding protein [Periweissella cryptocerci]|uniref:Phosphonate ABC transporter ATP-binding protein n=1 Tax=Periweissella cryptocerci TaxID=2506420 RepID=A0A4P6YXD9_9LACO|nr:phosphonate ABC transporter ATP-binding protein [Periweissella cryptocerci]QBO37487.1 phosphonate ABC transporter ATP-binding protein [Periweissella cryptocerci]